MLEIVNIILDFHISQTFNWVPVLVFEPWWLLKVPVPGSCQLCTAGRQQCPYSQTHLRLIADQHIILHGVGDVVNVEFQVGPLRDSHKSYACPWRCAVWRVLALYYVHSLQNREQIFQYWSIEFAGPMRVHKVQGSADGWLQDCSTHCLYPSQHKFSFKSVCVHTIAISLNNITNAREIKQNKTAQLFIYFSAMVQIKFKNLLWVTSSPAMTSHSPYRFLHCTCSSRIYGSGTSLFH